MSTGGPNAAEEVKEQREEGEVAVPSEEDGTETRGSTTRPDVASTEEYQGQKKFTILLHKNKKVSEKIKTEKIEVLRGEKLKETFKN